MQRDSVATCSADAAEASELVVPRGRGAEHVVVALQDHGCLGQFNGQCSYRVHAIAARGRVPELPDVAVRRLDIVVSHVAKGGVIDL